MKRQRRTQAGVEIILLVVALLCVPLLALAGNLEPSAAPTAGTMKTLQEVYDKLETIDSKITPVPPAPCEGAPVAKTGQTIGYAIGDDGALQKGVTLPIPRFNDQGNGTVKDNLTGLIWLKNAYPSGLMHWAEAVAYCNNLASGQAGLTDGSVAGDWRLPNIKELQSLIDFGRYEPALPAGHPFTNVQSSAYWSSTSSADFPDTIARDINIYNGDVGNSRSKKDYYDRVWPVRGGN